MRLYFIDKVESMEKNKRILAYKTFSLSESFYEHHFDGNPITPGVFLIEMAFQAAAVLIEYGLESKKTVPVMVDKVKFRNFTLPGERLKIELNVLDFDEKSYQTEFLINADGKRAASGDAVFAVDELDKFVSDKFIHRSMALYDFWLREAELIGFEEAT